MLRTGFLTFISRKKNVTSNFLILFSLYIFLHYFKSCSIFFKHSLNKSLVKNPSRNPFYVVVVQREGKRPKSAQWPLGTFLTLACKIHIFFNFRAFKRILCCHRNWGSPISSFEQKRNQNDTSNKRNFRKYFSMGVLKNCWKSQVRNEIRIHTLEQKNFTFS